MAHKNSARRIRLVLRPKTSLGFRLKLSKILAVGITSVLMIFGLVFYFQFANINTSIAGSGITLVQSKSIDAGSPTSASLTFTTNNVSGNLIIAAVRIGIPNPIPTVTDSRGNTYTLVKSQIMTGDASGYIFYAKNISGGANTVTVTIATSATLRFVIHEYSGVDPLSPLHSSNSAEGTSAAPNSGNISISSGSELVFGLSYVSNTRTFTSGSGFTQICSLSSKMQTEQRIAGAGTYSANTTLDESDQWGAIVATFYEAGGSLPIKLTYFTSKINENQVDLSWKTEAELNNDYFTVERSSDGKTFEKVLTKKGAGKSTTANYYNDKDINPLPGISYYRLKQTDYNGHFSYSKVENVKNEVNSPFENDIQQLSVTPTIFTDGFKINFITKSNSFAELVIVNNAGQEVYSEKIPVLEGNNNYEFNKGSRFLTGIYYVRLFYNGQVLTKKILKKGS